jgi:regulatory protein
MIHSKSYTVIEATKVLEHYCAYQERCHKEVEKKLKDLNMIPEAQEQIILHLLQHNFLNEERFAKAFVRGKFSIKKWGRIKIVKELKFKQISTYNITTALKEIDEETYLETLHKIAEKKLSLIKESNSYKKRNKLSNYLISRGFESNLAYKKSNELITN